jgi:molybdopterin-guanine dinucleotide biosynthesis protein B/molybdopterin-guanine dinucleotide biosynthesis protein
MYLIVNAGGASRRMGANKALLRIDPSTTLVEHLIRRLGTLADDGVVVVANDPAVGARLAGSGVHVVADSYAGGGALGGLATGLSLCLGWAMAVACDMPLADPSVFGHLAVVAQDEAEAWDAVVPIFDGHKQVFHALYHSRCAPEMVAQVERSGSLAVLAALERVRVRWVNACELDDIPGSAESFVNVNTPEEWEQVRGRVALQK